MTTQNTTETTVQTFITPMQQDESAGKKASFRPMRSMSGMKSFRPKKMNIITAVKKIRSVKTH